MRDAQPTPTEPRPASGPDASGGDPPKSGKRKGSLFGPGLIIAASFIGPGTITTSIVTGA
ncbi:MAG: manganese transporter, partial [Brachybacterium faecium]